MDINNATYMKFTGYAGCLILSVVMSLPLYSCSSEKATETEIAKQHSSETAAIQPSDVRPKEALPSPVVKGETMEQEANRTSPDLPIVTKANLRLENQNSLSVLKVIAEGSAKGGNPVTFTYEWTNNGNPAGKGDSLSGFKRGDKVSVKITPYDGKEYGMARFLSTEINNTPPTIIEHREVNFDGKTYTYQIKAVDPDGDTLTYNLKQAPQGMVIDKSTGLITWKVDEKTAGKFPATVQVSDGHGGEATYNFEVTIAAEAPRQ